MSFLANILERGSVIWKVHEVVMEMKFQSFGCEDPAALKTMRCEKRQSLLTQSAEVKAFCGCMWGGQKCGTVKQTGSSPSSHQTVRGRVPDYVTPLRDTAGQGQRKG